MAVVPFDRALDPLPILKQKNHQGAALNLLLKVKRLGVRAFSSYDCGVPPGVIGENRRDRG
jgi:hypothetical protein